MSIFVSEPGRPVGTRLPEAFRARRVDDVTELTESHAINPGRSEATDAEFQAAANAGRYRALQEYGAAAAGERREQRPYLPVSEIASPALYRLPATATISEALSVMDEHQVHHLVITADENVAGLIDLRWLLAWLHENQGDAMSQTFVHIELPAFLTASPETDAHQLAVASFGSVSGLKQGATVEVAGVQIGKVESIRLDPSSYEAVVRMSVDQDVKLQEDSIASIRTAGIIGDRYVDISPGGSPALIKPGGEITETESAINLEELVSKYIFEKK